MNLLLDKVFEALASAPRRKILAYLSEAELSTSQLAERFAMSTPAISRHLSVLENAQLVSSERRGQFVLYRLNADNLVNTLAGYTFDLCPVGRPLKRESRALAQLQAQAKSTGQQPQVADDQVVQGAAKETNTRDQGKAVSKTAAKAGKSTPNRKPRAV